MALNILIIVSFYFFVSQVEKEQPDGTSSKKVWWDLKQMIDHLREWRSNTLYPILTMIFLLILSPMIGLTWWTSEAQMELSLT